MSWEGVVKLKSIYTDFVAALGDYHEDYLTLFNDTLDTFSQTAITEWVILVRETVVWPTRFDFRQGLDSWSSLYFVPLKYGPI